MAYGLDVDHLDVVASGEVLHVGHAVDDGERLVDAVEGMRFGDFGCEGCDAFVEMAEGFGASEIVEEQRLDAAQCLVVALGTDRTVNLAVEVGEQFVEDVDAEIACGTCEEYVADGLTLALAEGSECVAVKECVERCKVGSLRGVEHWSGGFRCWSGGFACASVDECSQCPRCLQVEDVVEDNLCAMLAGLDNHLDGIDAGAANLEEIVCSTHFLDFEDVGEDGAEELFHLALWCLVFGGTLHLRGWQCLTVDLAVWCHWHDVHLHVGIRHHVFGQGGGSECGTDVVVAERCARFEGVVEHEMLVAHHLAHLGSSLTHAFDVERLALNLSQLDAETTQFHLCVDTSHVLNLSIFVPAAEVARVVHADRSSPAVLLDKRTIDERLGCALWESPVAASHLYAGKAQLACYALWHEVASGVNDEVPVVGYALADRDVLHTCAWSNAIIRGVVGALCRTIDVDDFDVVAIDTIHLFATTRCEADREVVEGVEQQTGHGCGIAATRALVVDEELTDGIEVLANLCWHDVERTTQREHRIHVLDVCVEGEGTVSADAVAGSELLHVDDHGDEVAQTCLMEHGTLWLARRARCVDHVGQSFRVGEVDGIEISRFALDGLCHEFVDEEGLGSSRTEIALSLLGLEYLVRGDEHLRLRVLEHVAQSLVRIFVVEWGIGSTCLVDREHCERELLGAVEHDTDEVVWLHTEVDELMSQCIGVVVHLGIGELAVLIHHCGCVWSALSLLGEEVGEGLAEVHVDVLTRTNLDDALSLFVAHDADARQGSFWLCHHALHRNLDSVGQTLHEAL